MKFQSLPSIFVYVLVFISINALFVLNEQSGFLMDSEFKLIIGEQFGENPILVDVSQYLFSLLGGQAFLWRLFPMAAIVISLLFSYRLGKNLFGKDSLQWAMIIVTCSIFMLFYGRFFSLDNFYFALQLPLVLLLIGFVKTKDSKKILIIIPLLLLCLLMDWYKTIGFVFLFGLGTYAFLFQVKKGIKVIYFIFATLLLVSNYTLVGASAYNNLFLFQAGSLSVHTYIGIALIGFLPFIGFAVSGLISLPVQIKRKDEFSIWMFLILIPAFLSYSILPIFVLGLLIGKHSLAFASERYKYKGLVKTVFLVHLTLILVSGIIALIWAFLEYRGAGFRAGLGLCSIYWILGFATVVGLYGGNMKYYLRAPLLAGPLFVLFFWVLVFQLNPNILGPYNIDLIGDSDEQVSLYISDLPLKKNLEYLFKKGSLPNAEIYNGNVNDSTMNLPALLDEPTFNKIESQLDARFIVEKKTYFSGIQLRHMFLIKENIDL
jgi:hypothetical protein